MTDNVISEAINLASAEAVQAMIDACGENPGRWEGVAILAGMIGGFREICNELSDDTATVMSLFACQVGQVIIDLANNPVLQSASERLRSLPGWQ